jgi:hypothetical protein
VEQLSNRYVIKKGLWYYADEQPTHQHRDANYTLVLEKAKWFTEKPNVDDWTVYGVGPTLEVVTIELYYEVKK